MVGNDCQIVLREGSVVDRPTQFTSSNRDHHRLSSISKDPGAYCPLYARSDLPVLLAGSPARARNWWPKPSGT